MFLRDCGTEYADFTYFNEREILLKDVNGNLDDEKVFILKDDEDYSLEGKTHLILDEFNKPLKKIPNGITHIYLSTQYNYPLELPESLVFLSVKGKFNQPLDNLPKNLKYLFIDGDFNNELVLPHKLEYLIFRFFSKYVQKLKNIPSSLRYLSLGGEYNQPLDNLNPDLKYLSVTKNFNQSLDFLPVNLEILMIGMGTQTECLFNQSLRNLPPNLKELNIGENCLFNSELVLPNKLEKLTLGRYFDCHKTSYLIKSLKKITFYGNVTYTYDKNDKCTNFYDKEVEIEIVREEEYY